MAINYGPNTLDYEMPNLISNHQAASTVNQTPSPAGSVAATSPPNMGTTNMSSVLPFSPTVSPTSSTSLVMHPLLSTRRTHRRSRSFEKVEQFSKASSVHGKGSQTEVKGHSHHDQEITITWDPRHHEAATKEQHSALVSDIGSVIRNHCPLLWESWKVVPHEVKQDVLHELLHHYELTNLDANQNQYINKICTSRFTQSKSDLHKHYEKYNGPEKKVKANSINKKLLHRSSFSYRLEERAMTFLCRTMSDVTSFEWHPLRRPMFPATIFALVRRLSLRWPSSYA
ncbi:hypothetical protein D8674_039663 [Pyrus ussuriensis x Pyrus communis]|uniref:Uncharacterized protein n=1 Tax=Pyrus ussuriensis x Pyrus communis TaxID=2448454 RepID=A0A5N5FLZ0_9ROSA|nr:hypothetical protein D8674_039663 [Pyrus ussuriensis x Pyrus communis]